MMSPPVAMSSGGAPVDVELRPKKRMSKFDSLKPVLNMLENFLQSHGVLRQKAATIVLGMIVQPFIPDSFSMLLFPISRYC